MPGSELRPSNSERKTTRKISVRTRKRKRETKNMPGFLDLLDEGAVTTRSCQQQQQPHNSYARVVQQQHQRQHQRLDERQAVSSITCINTSIFTLSRYVNNIKREKNNNNEQKSKMLSDTHQGSNTTRLAYKRADTLTFFFSLKNKGGSARDSNARLVINKFGAIRRNTTTMACMLDRLLCLYTYIRLRT